MEEQARQSLIRTKLKDGRLPVDHVPRIWGGLGLGETCVACETTITKDQLAMEGISLEQGGGGGSMHIILHTGCFRVWEAERRTLLKP